MASQSSVAAILRKKGFEMTLSRTTQGTYNPLTGGFSASTSESWAVFGITKVFGAMTVAFATQAGGTSIQTGDIQAIVEATVAPIVGDTMTVMGETWQVLNLDQIAPQGEALLYKIHLRR